MVIVVIVAVVLLVAAVVVVVVVLLSSLSSLSLLLFVVLVVLVVVVVVVACAPAKQSEIAAKDSFAQQFPGTLPPVVSTFNHSSHVSQASLSQVSCH